MLKASLNHVSAIRCRHRLENAVETPALALANI